MEVHTRLLHRRTRTCKPLQTLRCLTLCTVLNLRHLPAQTAGDTAGIMPSLVWSKFKRLLAPPVFEGDEEKTRAAAFLNTLLWASLATQIFSPLTYAGNLERGIVCVAAWTSMIAGCHWLLRRGSVHLASVVGVSVAWILVNLITATAGGIRGNGFSGCLIVAGCAGMLLGWRAMVA